jgi:hypothetical protein
MAGAKLEFDLGRINSVWGGDSLVFSCTVPARNEASLRIYASPEDSRRSGVSVAFSAQQLLELKSIVGRAEQIFLRAGAIR